MFSLITKKFKESQPWRCTLHLCYKRFIFIFNHSELRRLKPPRAVLVNVAFLRFGKPPKYLKFVEKQLRIHCVVIIYKIIHFT